MNTNQYTRGGVDPGDYQFKGTYDHAIAHGTRYAWCDCVVVKACTGLEVYFPEDDFDHAPLPISAFKGEFRRRLPAPNPAPATGDAVYWSKERPTEQGWHWWRPGMNSCVLMAFVKQWANAPWDVTFYNDTEVLGTVPLAESSGLFSPLIRAEFAAQEERVRELECALSDLLTTCEEIVASEAPTVVDNDTHFALVRRSARARQALAAGKEGA